MLHLCCCTHPAFVLLDSPTACVWWSSLKAAARDYHKELNYQEAVKEAYVAYASPGLSSEVESLLASAEVR